MKFLFVLASLLVLIAGLSFSQDCPETTQNACIDDIRDAYPVCKKAA